MRLSYFHWLIHLLCWTINCWAHSSWNHELLVGQRQTHYYVKELDDSDFQVLCRLSNTTHLKATVKKILKPRVVGSNGHHEVRDYIAETLQNLNWTIQLDSFNDTVPIFGELQFENIIATLNPRAERYLVLSCHYDSKYMDDVEFVGAIDSAVPCAMLINLVTVLSDHLQHFRDTSPSLMLIFFDGEEAFKDWNAKDSIYGARHLAEKWQNENFLHKIDLLILLDLLGAPHPTFYSYFANTQSWYVRLINIEARLSQSGVLERYYSNSMNSREYNERYFQPNALKSSFIEDDHTPFLQRNVPILHIIPIPFPNEWHTKDDNEAIIDYTTTENLAHIIRIFTMEYLQGAFK